MYVRVRLLGSDTSSQTYINCRSINQTIDELRERVAQKWNCVKTSNVRLFFDGKELINGYSLYEYNIKVNNLIQLMIRNECQTKNTENAIDSTVEESNDNTIEEINEEKNFIDSDNYYRIGDFVDALNVESGAWFEARVTRIAFNSLNKCFKYFVDFDKQSIGSNIGVLFHQIRPQSSIRITFDDIVEGQLVLANFNITSNKERGDWFECKIEKKIQKNRRLYATVYLADIILKRQIIKFIDEIYKIETICERKLRSEDKQILLQFGSKSKRISAPDCEECNDNSMVNCKTCSCNECGSKKAPDKQILCDECNSIYHIWCLNTPLNEVPEEDWYCQNCRNSDKNQVIAIQSDLLLKRRKNLNRKGVKDWGRGMACVGRTQVSNIVPKDHFGPIPGIEVGMCWRFRFQASEAGVHTPLVAGIHGKENSGAYSVVFSCSYDEDIDLGEEFYYTASGGKDSGNKCRVGGPQTKDQILKRCNKALALDCWAPFNDINGANAGLEWQKGKPVRVLRSGNARGASKKSIYLPKVGVRYDGIYKVVKYWPQTGDSGFLVWRYLLRRDDPTPPPWTQSGKNHVRRLALTLIYPEGWTKETASKRSWNMDEKAFKHKKQKMSSFSIPKNILKLIESDEKNRKLWKSVLTDTKCRKSELMARLEMNFKCVCCLDVVKSPVTTQCSHNICKICLDQSLKSGVNLCPICRTELKDYKNLSTNQRLSEILSKLQSILQNV